MAGRNRGSVVNSAPLARGAEGSAPAHRVLCVPRAHRCRQDAAGARAGPVHVRRRRGAHPARHVGVHGKVQRLPAGGGTPRLRRIRRRRPADGARPAPAVLRGAARRNREGPPGCLQHPPAGAGGRPADGQLRAKGGFPQHDLDHDLEHRGGAPAQAGQSWVRPGDGRGHVREDEAAAAAAEIVSNNSEETEKETPQDSGEEPTQTEADRVHDEEIGEAKTLPPHETKTVTDINVAAGEAQIDAAGKSRRRFSQGMSLSFLGRFRGLTRQRKIILFIAVILIVLIIVISAFALGRRGATSSDFDAIYNEALTKYEEGQSLRQLNPSLSQDSFRQAQQILLANKDTFDEGSSEDQQIEELLAKVTSGITGDGGQVSVSEVGADQSKMLSLAIDNPKASYFSQNEDFVYFIKSDGITKVDKGNSEEEELIEKSWKQEGGLGLFGSNVYVLDRQNGILKFVPTDDGFSETDYFTGDSPDFSEAAAIAIDGSIYVLHTNGTINKYTRGEEESFEITGLTTNFSSPTRILTSEDFDNIYILDRGNSRIVVLDKAGAFVNSYTAAVIKSAREFDVDEVGGKIYVLSGEKVYQIEI